MNSKLHSVRFALRELFRLVNCTWSFCLCFLDDTTWALGDIDCKVRKVFDLKNNPECKEPLAEPEAKIGWEKAWKRLLHDAGGSFPDYRSKDKTDALGRK